MFNNKLINTVNSNNSAYDELLKSLDIDYTSMFRGIVVDNDDPLLLGRVKVRVPQIYGSEDNKNNVRYLESYAIPWATSAVMVGAGNNTGAYLIPNVGDIVFVTFEGGNPKLPIYFGGILNKNSGETSYIGTSGVNTDQTYKVDTDDFNTDLYSGAQRVIYKSIKGATILIDDTDQHEYIKIIDQLGQMISLENTSNEVLERNRDRNSKMAGKYRSGKIVIQNSTGSSMVLSDSGVTIKAPKVRLETSEFEVIDEESKLEPEDMLIDTILGTYENLIDLSAGYTLGYISIDGNYTYDPTYFMFNARVEVAPDTDYTISTESDVYSIGYALYDENDYPFFIEYRDNTDKATIHNSPDTKYLKVCIKYNEEAITDEVVDELEVRCEWGTGRHTGRIEPVPTEDDVNVLHNKADSILDYVRKSGANE